MYDVEKRHLSIKAKEVGNGVLLRVRYTEANGDLIEYQFLYPTAAACVAALLEDFDWLLESI